MAETATTESRTLRETPLRWRWFLAGAGFAAFLIATQAMAVGGLAGLLLVGETSELRPFIEGILGDVPVFEGVGHDAQIYFAIAHDLDGDTISHLIDNPGIRYRRPVLPFLASFGGLLSGSAVLWATSAWIAVGTGFAAMSFRALLERLRASPVWMLALFAYPGFWLGVRLFTPDMIALGAALLGLVLFLRSEDRLAVPLALFTLAALTKEAFLLVPLSLAAATFFAGKRWRGMVVGGIPAAAFLGWVTLVLTQFEVGAVDGNFGLPLAGIIEARSYWPLTPTSDQVYVYLTMVVLLVAIGATGVARSPLTRWLILPWPVLALISSEWIWWFGNGLLRSFAPVVLFTALAFAERSSGISLREAGP